MNAKRAEIFREINAYPELSDRAIAKKIKCSPTTVGIVRKRILSVQTTVQVDIQAGVQDKATTTIKKSYSQKEIVLLKHQTLNALEALFDLVARRRKPWGEAISECERCLEALRNDSL